MQLRLMSRRDDLPDRDDACAECHKNGLPVGEGHSPSPYRIGPSHRLPPALSKSH